MRTSKLSASFQRFRDRGDTAALAFVFDATSPALLRVARRILADASSAEDVVQSTFLAAIERADAWDEARPIEPWLFGILIRQVGLARRKAARVLDSRRLEPALDPTDPLDEAAREEVVARIVAALATLPLKDRAVLEPWLRGESCCESTAPGDDVGGSTLRMRVQRALSRLRRSLPAGLAGGIAVSSDDRRALLVVRNHVLDAARSRAVAGSFVSSTTTSAMGVKILLVAGVALLVTAGTFAWRLAHDPLAPTRPQVAATPASPSTEPGSDVAGSSTQREPVRSATESTTNASISRVVGTLEKKQDDEIRALDGITLGSDGAPVGGARIRIFDDEAPGAPAIAEGVSGADGAFRIPLERATFVHAIAECVSHGRGVALGTPYARPCKIVLASGRTVEGRVSTEDGSPAILARITIADEATQWIGPLETATDCLGHFRLDHVAARPKWVSATDSGRSLVGFTMIPPEGAPEGLMHSPMSADIVLHATGSVSFRVVDRDSKLPIVGATVIAQSTLPGPHARQVFELATLAHPEFQTPFGQLLRTDATGLVTFEGFGDRHLDVAIGAEGYEPYQCGYAFGDVNRFQVELSAGCVAQGVARNVDGSPVAGALVSLDKDGSGYFRGYRRSHDDYPVLRFPDGSENPFSLATITRSDGTFRLTGLPDRGYLKLSQGGRVAFAAFEPRAKGDVVGDIVLTLGAKVRIEGFVRDEDGKGLTQADGLKIWVAPASELAKLTNGTYSLECAPTAMTVVWAVAPGYVHERVVLDSMLTERNTVDITLKRGLSIAGRVERPTTSAEAGDPAGIGGATIIAWPADPTEEERNRTGGWITEMNLGSTTSAADGTFTLQGLPDRPLRLRVSAGGFAEREIDGVTPGSRNVTIPLSRP